MPAPAPWRLIETQPAPGAWNMAVDEAILEAAGRREVLPTLRLYAWSPPCLSLGYAQPIADVDLDRLHALGWHIVRRPTGGRAILHTDELTYSVIGPASEPVLSGSVLESYRRISAALLRTVQNLGITANSLQGAAPSQERNPSGPVCFEVPSNYEITVDGKKLIGSAQARRQEGVLQHGSLPLFGDLGRITQGLWFDNEENRTAAAGRVIQRAATVAECLDRMVSWQEAAQALISAFQVTLQIELKAVELTRREKERADALVQEKYRSQAWLDRI